MGSSEKHKKHKKHKSERKSKYDERPPSLKLILKVNGTPEHGSGDSPYNIHHPDTVSDTQPTHSEHSEKHKKSKKKKKKKDREKRHKHHKKDRHHHHREHRRESSADAGMEDEDSSLMAGDNFSYYASMSTSSAISSQPITKPMIPMEPKIFHQLQNVPLAIPFPSTADYKPETPNFQQDSPMTPSSMDSGREPRTCVLKLKQSRSPLAKLLDHLLKSLEKRDPHQFFAWPVTDDIAPGYSAIITKPMDFSAIRQKIEENEYQTLTDFIDDFRLMCDNAIRYNHPETVYNKAARRLLQAGMKLLQPDSLKRGPVSIYIRELSTRDLGFDPTAKMEQQDESYSVDSADETIISQPPEQPVDPVILAQQEEREKRERIKAELDPKGPFEPFVDSMTADEILEQVQRAAKEARRRLHKRKAHKMGFLRAHADGTTSMKILIPSADDETPERTTRLGDFTGRLQKGTGLLQSFREDRRNNVKLSRPLDYGAFGSFAPSFDSRFTNISSEEQELIQNTYGDEAGASYAASITRFTQDSPYGGALANRLLDLLTNGEHSKTLNVLETSEQLKTVQREVETLLPDYQSESKKLHDITIDFDQLKTLKEIGVDTSFLGDFEKVLKPDVQCHLDTTTSLIEQLHHVQNKRLSAPIKQHLSFVQHPNKQENELAEQITTNLTDIAKKLPPSAIATVNGVRKAMGMSGIAQDHRPDANMEVDTTPMDMDIEPETNAVTTEFDNELRELLGGK